MPSDNADVQQSNGFEQKPVANIDDVENCKSEQKEYVFEDALGLIGFGKVQYMVLLVSGITLMAVINETMGLTIITIASQCDFGTGAQEKAIMNASCYVGILVAAYPWGYLADIVGRRVVILRATMMAATFSIISTFISNFWLFVLLRFLAGLSISGASSTVYAYLGEFNTLRHRPLVINYASMFVGISLVYTPVMAWLVLPYSWSFSFFGLYDFRSWRLLVLINCLPGLVSAIWISQLPETPKLLLSHGKTDEALRVLNWIYEENMGKKSQEFPVKRLISEENEQSKTLGAKKAICELIVSTFKQTLPLFKPPHVLSYVTCCFVMFGLFFTSSGMGLWFPEIQNRLGLGASKIQMSICEVVSIEQDDTSNTTALECNDAVTEKTYIDSIIMGSSYIVSYIVLGIVIHPLGRKKVLIGTLALSGICGLALQWVNQPLAVVVLFCGFLMLPGLNVSVLSGAVVDLIPTHLRGKAMCLCLMFGRFGSVVGINLIGAILEPYCDMTFYIFSGFMILCMFLTLTLPI